jgi:hypothetical protein
MGGYNKFDTEHLIDDGVSPLANVGRRYLFFRVPSGIRCRVFGATVASASKIGILDEAYSLCKPQTATRLIQIPKARTYLAVRRAFWIVAKF